MAGAMDPYWRSLLCVCTLIVSLLTQMYKCVMVTEQEGQGAGCTRGNLNRCAFDFFKRLVPNVLEPPKPPSSLKDPSQPHLCFVYIQEVGFYVLFIAC